MRKKAQLATLQTRVTELQDEARRLGVLISRRVLVLETRRRGAPFSRRTLETDDEVSLTLSLQSTQGSQLEQALQDCATVHSPRPLHTTLAPAPLRASLNSVERSGVCASKNRGCTGK